MVENRLKGSPDGQLTVILKPTLACNGSCSYCSPGCGVRQPLASMSPETLRLSMEALGEYCLEREKSILSIIWHGGEPTLMAPEFYREARRLEEEIIESQGIGVQNAIQSNLTTDAERIRAIAGILGVRNLGSSYDPDGLRALPHADFRQTWLTNVIRLRRRYDIGVIYVINKKTRGREGQILAHLQNLGIRSVQLNWMYPSPHHPEAMGHMLSPLEVGESLVAFLSLRPRFLVALSGLPDLDGRDGTCCFKGACAERFLGISPQGDIYNCGRFMDLGLAFGNVKEGGIAEQVDQSELRQHLLARDDVLQAGECADCERWGQCHGGCPADGYLAQRTPLARTGMCAAFRRISEMT